MSKRTEIYPGGDPSQRQALAVFLLSCAHRPLVSLFRMMRDISLSVRSSSSIPAISTNAVRLLKNPPWPAHSRCWRNGGTLELFPKSWAAQKLGQKA